MAEKIFKFENGRTFISNKNMPDEIFSNKILKGITMANPHLPFIIYIPFVVFLVWFSLFPSELSLISFFTCYFAGFIWWSVFEYITHRYLFHFDPQSAFGKKIMYVLHHGHHEYPNDKRLMVSNPIVSLPTAFILLLLTGLVFGWAYSAAFMAGKMTMYMLYDWMHFASHNYNFKNALFQKLKKHHMKHHYQDGQKNYGFTSTVWDGVMGTKK